jgi:hypothetical protein
VGKYREKGLQTFDMQKAIDEKPTYVVFNGSESSLVGEHALTAKVGETVRLFIGNGGPNLVSSFHVIGEIFDRVRFKGGIQIVLNGLSGEVIVNDKTFNSVMPPMSQLNDDELANILTYVTHSWGNHGYAFSASEVAKTRKSTPRPAGAAN